MRRDWPIWLVAIATLGRSVGGRSTMKRRQPFIRSLDADVHLELFLVAAVAAILLIRFYLRVTHYPQLGAGSVHVAHMLWGGLAMLAAMVVLLVFINRDSIRLAAVLGGLGFGTFIDEVGKFLTKDNDYFFQPAVAVIYVVFVLLVLAWQAIARRLYTPEEYLLNALQEMEELALQDLDVRERGRALWLLDRSDPDNPLVAPLRQLVERAPLAPEARPGPYTRARGLLHRRYDALTRRRRFRTAVVAFFVAQIGLKLVYVVLLVFFPWMLPSPDGGTPPRLVQRFVDLGFADWGQLGSTALSAVFVGLGVAGLARSRPFAYRMFKRSVLVTIFLTQVFMFYAEQLSAITGLALNVLLLFALEAALDFERTRIEAGSARSAMGAAAGAEASAVTGGAADAAAGGALGAAPNAALGGTPGAEAG